MKNVYVADFRRKNQSDSYEVRLYKVERMQHLFAQFACFVFSLAVLANDPPRGIYRASEVPGCPRLLASGLAWRDAGM